MTDQLARRFHAGWGAGAWCASWGGAVPPSRHVSPVIDHVIGAQRRLISQYADKPKILGMIAALAAPLQDLEQAAQDALAFRSIASAYGRQLDVCGRLLLWLRHGAEDNSYRLQLAARTIAAASQCSPEDVRAVLDTLMAGANPVLLTESPPGVTILRTRELPQPDGEIAAVLVAGAAPAANRVITQWERPTYETGAAGTFGWAEDDTAGIWAEVDQDPGPAGFWAEGSDGRTREPRSTRGTALP